MEIYYYLSDMPEDVAERYVEILEGVYGGMIDKFTREEPRKNLELYKGKILITNDIYDLVQEPEKEPDINVIVDVYENLLINGTIIRFDKSSQCNSEYINKQLEELGLSGWDNFKKLLILAIENFKMSRRNEYAWRRRVIHNAKRERPHRGNMKGDKLITKRSIEMKAKIEQMSREFRGDKTDGEIIKELGMGRNTYYKYKKELKEGIK